MPVSLFSIKCLRYADLVPRHSLLRKEISVRLLRRHFVFLNMAKNSAHSSHRLTTKTTRTPVDSLKGTNECKVSKRAEVHHFESLRLSEISRQDSNRIQIDAVSPFTRQMKPYRFENASLLSAFSNRPAFGNGLGRRRVNGRCNRIESDVVTNKTAFV